MKHKLTRVLFFSLFLLTLVCLTALAASAAYRVEGTGEEYDTLAEAVAAAPADDTITLTSASTISDAVTISKNLKIQQTDASFTTTFSNTVAITGNVTFKGVHISQKGKSTIIAITNGTTMFENCVFESHTAVGAPRTITITGSGTTPVVVFRGGNYTVPSDTKTDARFVSGYQNYIINVEDGVFTGDNTVRAFFRLGNTGTLNILGGTFTTEGSGFVFCDSHSGTVNISKGGAVAPSFTKNTTSSNAAVLDLNSSGKVNISAGTFVNTYSPSAQQKVLIGAIFDVRNHVKLTITGGSFSSGTYVPLLHVRDNGSIHPNAVIKITDGEFTAQWRTFNISSSGSPSLEIAGGTYLADERIIWANSGSPTIDITGGTFGSETSAAACQIGASKGVIKISGDTVVKGAGVRTLFLEGSASLEVFGNAEIYNCSTANRYTINVQNNTGYLKIYDNAYVEGGYEVIRVNGANTTAPVSVYGNATVIGTGNDPAVYVAPEVVNSSLTFSDNVSVEQTKNKSCLYVSGAIPVTINGGTYKIASAAAVLYSSGATVTIKGGYFTGSNAEFVLRFVKNSTVNIYGGYFYLDGLRGSAYMVRLEGGTTDAPATLNIYGGTFVSDNNGAVIRNGLAADTSDTINVYGGTFVANSRDTKIFWDADDTDAFNTNLVSYSCRGGLLVHMKGTKTAGVKVKYPTVSKSYTYNSINMEPSAELRLVENSAGIRFTSTVSRGFVERLTSAAKDGAVTYSTIIVPTDYLEGLAGFSCDTLDTLGKSYLVIDAEEGITENLDGSLTICATIAPLNSWNIARKFSAVVMATYTEKGSDTTAVVYSDFRQSANSRSAANLAKKALKNPYAYNADQIAILETFAAEADADKPVDIYVIAGQSNASGYGSFNTAFAEANPDYVNGYSRVLYSGAAGYGSSYNITYSDITELGTAKLGLGGGTKNLGAEVGMADYFNQYMYNEDSDRTACIVKWSDGGTNLLDVLTGSNARNGNWLPPSFIDAYGANGEFSGQQYRSLMEIMQNAVDNLEAEGYDVSVKGVFWMQGEAERALSSLVFEGDTLRFGSATTPEESRVDGVSYTIGTPDFELLSFDLPFSYPSVFNMLMEDMRNDFGEMTGEDLSEMPFVIGEISASFGRNFNDYEAEFIAMQRAMAEEFDNVYTVNSSVLATGYYSGDNAHWTAEDITLIGKMVARAFMLHYDDTLDIPEPFIDEDTPIAIVYDENDDEIGCFNSLAYAIGIAPEGATIELQDDVIIDSAALNIANQNAITLNGNGYTLYSNSPDHALRFIGTDITLIDFNLYHNTESAGAYAACLYDNAIVTIDGDSSFNSYQYGFYLDTAGCTLNVLYGAFETRFAADITNAPIVCNADCTVNIEDGTFTAAQNGSCVYVTLPGGVYHATLDITGGSFYSAQFEGEEGGYCIVIDNAYVQGGISYATFVGQPGVCAINNPKSSAISMNRSSCTLTGTSIFTQEFSTFEVFTKSGTSLAKYDDFASAINSCPAGGTVKVLKDFSSDTSFYVNNDKAVTVDGNGKTFTINMNGNASNRPHALDLYGTNLTIKNLNVVQGSDENGEYGQTYFAYFYDGANLTVDGGTWNMAYWCFVISYSDCSLTIKSGTFTVTHSESANYAIVKLNTASTVTITGGTFSSATIDATGNNNELGCCVRVQPNTDGAVIKITGGTFTAADDANCIHVTSSTYAVTENINTANLTCNGGTLYYAD